MRSVLLLAFIADLVIANNNNIGRITGRSLTAPVCGGGTSSCSLTARDEINNQTPQNTNQSTISVVTSGQKLKAIFSYDAASLPELDYPVTAQAEVTFIALYQWVDTGDNIPQDSELSQPQLITPPAPAQLTFSANSYQVPQYIPFTTSLTIDSNFTISCYIVKNRTFSVPPDYISTTGYGSVCHIKAAKSVGLDVNARVALRINIETGLSGGGVNTATSQFNWSLRSALQANRLVAGGTNVIFGTKAQPLGHAVSDASIVPGLFSSTGTGNAQTVVLGLVSDNTYAFEYDVAFEPVALIYQNSVSSVTVSVFVLLAILVCTFTF